MTNVTRAIADPRRRLALALAVSVLLHIATVWKLPPVPLSLSADVGKESGPLVVQLTPPAARAPSAPPAAAAPRQRAQPPARTAPPPPRTAERPRPIPPVIGRQEPVPTPPSGEPRVPAAKPAPAPAPSTRPSPPATDLAAYIEARRRARGEATPPAPASEAPTVAAPAEDENARANRIAAANLGLDRKPTFGSDTRKGGGIFQITRRSYDYAEFVFFGWNKDIRRDTVQTIEVRKGSESDIRIAILRRMIAIIREHEDGDFVWESHRLNRHVNLSARPRDNAGLEDFLWREFFDNEPRPAQRP
jgi:hypothetical protein